MNTLFWYDFETTGIQPSRDRPMQVAGVRTNEALEEIEPPLNLYCQLSDDILPHPAACLITGITPEQLKTQGLPEAEFMARLHDELIRPGTCSLGYNSLRFDDEVVRYSLYRNLYDPYAREWQGGNSRWDLIDLVRAACALRPEGIQWPEVEGRVSLKLEHLSAANGLEHGQAHDALSDVRATLALARLIRARQPKLYAYYYALRHKAQVAKQISLLTPLVHISGRFSAERRYLSLVLPLAWHPTNRNAVILCDLMKDPQPLLEESVEVLKQRLYQRYSDLEAEELPVPLKLAYINRCPMLAPLSVLSNERAIELGVDLKLCMQRAQAVREAASVWQPKLAELYIGDSILESVSDPEQKLYSGFLGSADRRLCDQIRRGAPNSLISSQYAFEDARLPELLFRYRARNLPDSLTKAEHQRWLQFCQARLSDPKAGAPITLDAFEQAVHELQATALTTTEAELLKQWSNYGQQLRAAYFPKPDLK